MSNSKAFFNFLVCFIIGIFLASFFEIPLSLILISLFLSILLIFFFLIFRYRKEYLIIGLCVFFLISGIFRYFLSEAKFLNSPLLEVNNSKKGVTFEGIIVKEPEIDEKIQKLVVQSKWGKILIYTSSFCKYHYGDKLRITGRLKAPPIFKNFNYRDYLKKEGIYSLMYWPKIRVIEKDQGNLIMKMLFSLKEKFKKTIFKSFPPSQSLLLSAMILGEKNLLPKELKEKLNVTGLRHITAISGLHITILTSILMTILIGIGLWRQQAFLGAIILIILFILITGLQPSAIRAAIMGGAFLSGQYLGRASHSLRALFFAGTIMLLQNPFLLKSDLGFQLSFLAVIGIIHLTPLLRHWLEKIPNIFQLREVLTISLSAQIFTFPLLLYHFGYIPLLAPLTNILVVPLLYWILFFGILFLVFGSVFSLFAFFFGLPLYFLLTYILFLINYFSKLPFNCLKFEASIFWLLFYYLVLAGCILFISSRRRYPYLIKP